MQGALHAREVRLALLLLLLGRCFEDDAALAHAGGEGMVVDILGDADARLRHHAASFLQVQLPTHACLLRTSSGCAVPAADFRTAPRHDQDMPHVCIFASPL